MVGEGAPSVTKKRYTTYPYLIHGARQKSPHLEVVSLRLVLLHQLQNAPLEPVEAHPGEEDVRVHAGVGHKLRPRDAAPSPG